MIKQWYIILLLICTSGAAAGQEQQAREHTREGNKVYKDGDLEKAEVEYRKAIESRSDYYKARYNLANVQYQNENFENAANLYKELSLTVDDPMEKAELHYNIGNCLMEQKKYKEAYESYKKSLRLNPADKDAKYNLLYARSKLSLQKQPDENGEPDKGDQQNQQQPQGQDQQNQQDQQEQKQEDQGQQENQQEQKEQPQEQKQKNERKMDKKSAEQQLARMAEKDKKTKEKLDKKNAVGVRNNKKEKDW